MAKEITIKEIYDLVDRKTNELDKNLSAKIDRLTDAFMTLEEGRVSTLERQMAEIIANFSPVKNVVYGMVGLILTAVIVAVIYLVVKAPSI